MGIIESYIQNNENDLQKITNKNIVEKDNNNEKKKIEEKDNEQKKFDFPGLKKLKIKKIKK
jgi:hypothetical protein